AAWQRSTPNAGSPRPATDFSSALNVAVSAPVRVGSALQHAARRQERPLDGSARSLLHELSRSGPAPGAATPPADRPPPRAWRWAAAADTPDGTSASPAPCRGTASTARAAA